MVDSRKRASASLKVKYKSTTLSQFISQFGLDISHAGMFIKTKTPLEPGALIRLELQLSDGTPVIVGSGRVHWRRAATTQSQAPAGMGIEFTRLDPESRRFVDSIVDGREGRPSRFEQTEGAEHAAGSPKVSSVPAPSSSHAPSPASMQPPPPSAPPAQSVPPQSAPPQSAPPQPASPSPTPQLRSVQASLPPAAPQLFAGSRLRGAPSTDPFGEAPAQSSFFAHGRVAGAAPSHPSQSQVRTPAARESSVNPMPAARPDATDKLVDKLFADAIPKSPDSEPPTTDEADDPITDEFRGPDRDRGDMPFASIAPPAASPGAGPSDPPPPLPRPASLRSPDLVLKAPSQFPAPLTTSTSDFPESQRSTPLIVSLVVLVLLLAAAAFFYLR